MKKQMRTGRMRKFSGACLLVLVALFAIPAGQAMAKDYLSVYGDAVQVAETQAPPDHGSVFPVTISGQLKFTGQMTRSRRSGRGFKKVPLSLTKKQKTKVLKSCKAGFQVPLAVGGGPLLSLGTATSDAAGFFSTTIQFNTIDSSGTQLHGGYGGGLNLGIHEPAALTRHERFGFHLVCWASPTTDLTNGGAGTVHPF